jgi:flagellar hook-associated protein 2
MSSTSITPLTFTGISKYSTDFQTILSRAVAIANLPVRQLQSQQSNLLTQKQLLADLNGSVSALASTLSSLADLGDNKAISASTSNASRVSVSINGKTQAATHTITEITSVAKAASETSASGYATADSTNVTSGDSLELAIGSKTYTIPVDSTNNNLNGLRDAINQLGAGVTASVLNTGNADTPYYLSISSNITGQNAIQVRTTAGDTGSNILTATNSGANAVFKLDGIPVSRADNVIGNVIDGVTFSILSATGPAESVVLTTASDRTQLVSALTNLASDYNTVSRKVNAQIGKAAGALSGDSSIRQVKDAQRSFLNFQGSPGSNIKALTDLGIVVDSTGAMSFDTAKFYSLSNADLSAAFDFLGSAATGLGSTTSKFTAISDAVTGSIITEQNQIDIADARISTQVDKLNERIDYMQKSLNAQLQAADALLASLDSQQSILTGSLQSLNLVLYGKQTG